MILKDCITRIEVLLRLPEPDTVGAKRIWDDYRQESRSEGAVKDKKTRNCYIRSERIDRQVPRVPTRSQIHQGNNLVHNQGKWAHDMGYVTGLLFSRGIYIIFKHVSIRYSRILLDQICLLARFGDSHRHSHDIDWYPLKHLLQAQGKRE